MLMLLELLRRFWWAVPLAGAAAFGWWEHHQVGVAAAHVAQLEQQLGSAEASISQLQAGIQAQNGAVERILAQGQANVASAKAQAAQRAQAAAKVQVIYRTRIQTIEAAPVPATCASAAAWAQQQAQGLAAGWSK